MSPPCPLTCLPHHHHSHLSIAEVPGLRNDLLQQDRDIICRGSSGGSGTDSRAQRCPLIPTHQGKQGRRV